MCDVSSYVTTKIPRSVQHEIKYSKYNYLFSIIGFIILSTIAMAEVKKETSSSPPAPPTETTSNTNVAIKTRAKSTKWGVPRQTVSTFKGAIPQLNGKVFMTGPSQATRYDETYKALLYYFNSKYDHRIHKAFESKDYAVGLALLTRPKAPKKKTIVQEATPGDASVLRGVEREVIDKDSDAFFEYQEEMKRYVSDKARYTKDMQDCFNIIIGQCSPAIEQCLESEDTFSNIKETSNSIELMKLIEKLCYNYKPHEYTPLGAWTALDKLTALIQPDTVHEVKHYETYKSTVEMCKASKVNFAMICTENIDMAMTTLRNNGKITTTGSYADGAYYRLNDIERPLVDSMAEEICLSTRFLSLASNKLHMWSKQELVNDMVKGDDNYPKTIAGTLRFLQYHNLRGKTIPSNEKGQKLFKNEIAFAQDDDNEDKLEIDSPPSTHKKSKICGQWKDETCPYKKKHTWKECPRNKWGTNYGKEVDNNGELVMCTVCDTTEFLAAMEDTEDPAIIERFYDIDGDEIKSSDNNNRPTVDFYSHYQPYNITVHDTIHHMFNQIGLQHRINHAMTQEKSTICKTWILLDNQSTVDVFHNADLLINIREVDNHITVHCNAGKVQVNMMGELAGYGSVWYYPDGIANILSLYKVSTRFHIEYDSRLTGSFKVWRNNDTFREFRPSNKGLYFSNCDITNETILVNDAAEPKTINTVSENLTKFTTRQIRDAEITRKFQNNAGLSTRALL